MSHTATPQADQTSDGNGPTGQPDERVSYWLNELNAAQKREKRYRKDGRRVLKIYAGTDDDESSFDETLSNTPYNILYSNTETLLPALYSTVPRPVVQRRFKDADPLGKIAAQAGQRVLEFLVDTNSEGYETFDEGIRAATLDGLLPGRGVTAVKYDAEFGEMAPVEGEQEGTPYANKELACIDTRRWDRVLFGYATKWSKVPWVAYEEHLDRHEAREKFGKKIADKLIYTKEETEDTDSETKRDDEKHQGERKTVCCYQIWDKDATPNEPRKVRYVCQQYKDDFLKVEDDPLQLTGFFNCPRPLVFVEKNDLKPVALYRLYENQAKELNRLTRRINHIVQAIKARGVYDSELGEELANLMKADDNALVPADKSSSLAAEKGLQNAIWFMPIEALITTLAQLYTARQQCKQVIYEITGISDILRGSSVASETATAQNIKNQWGTLRLKRLQREVMRYTRDLLRMMLEIAATKFSEETWAKMTGLPFLTKMQAQQLQASAQVGDPQAVQKLQSTPTWEQVLTLLKDDVMRAYRIDIETNSTIEPEAAEDHKEMTEMMTAMGQYLNGVGPLVAKGVMPFGVAQNMLLAITRRFRFGSEIEDDIKQMQPPKPEDDGKASAAQEAQATMQVEQQKMQMEQQKMQMEGQARQAEMQHAQASEAAQLQHQQQVEQNKMQLEVAKIQAQRETEAMRIEAEKQARLAEFNAERQTEKIKAQMQQDTELKKAALVAATQIEIANIKAMTDANAVMQASDAEGQQVAQTSSMMEKILARQEHLIAAIIAPKKIERDQQGRALRVVSQV